MAPDGQVRRTGTLSDPHISKVGVAFLAKLLEQLSDDQLRDLFTVARFADKPAPPGKSPATVDEWIDVFKHKREEIVTATCR